MSNNELYDEIRQRYQEEHDELTEDYHDDPENYPGGRESFDQLHAALWARYDAELVMNGLRPVLDKPMMAEMIEKLSNSIDTVHDFLDMEYPGWKDNLPERL